MNSIYHHLSASDINNQRIDSGSHEPMITVVMPVRNESRFIRDTLVKLISQEYPLDCFEIIVADGMSDDGTREIVTEMAGSYPQIRLLDNLARLSSAGRNVGFRNGRGDYFLVVDGHCYIPDNRLFRNIVDCFEKSGADCLGRPQPLDPPGLTTFQKSVALARASRLGHGGDSLIFGEYEGFASPVSNGAAYRREVFEKVGYVDESFDAAEDVEFNYRVEQAGLRCYTSPKLTIRYYPRETLRGLFRQMTRYGKGRNKFISKHKDALTVNQLIPSAFVCGLFVLPLSFCKPFVPGSWFPVFILWTVYSLYVLILLAESCHLSAKEGWDYLPQLPLIFITVHIGLGWGFVKEACTQLTIKGDI